MGESWVTEGWGAADQGRMDLMQDQEIGRQGERHEIKVG